MSNDKVTPMPKPRKPRKTKATAVTAQQASNPAPKKPVRPVLPELQYEDLTNYGMPADLAVPLYQAVTTMRGGESVAEANFVAWLLTYCTQFARLRMVDAAGNVHFTIPTPQGKDAKTLFVAHTDTVHYKGGKNNVGFDGAMLHGVDEPLGADDGAGIAILCFMMSKGVPGRYVFTRQEESGGIGAKFIAENLGGVLGKYKRAIAFDRRGTGEVITMQGGVTCASDKFGEALADALNEHGLLYTTSDKGVYTDTKEFRHWVPECVNVATGYYQEHGSSEHLDLTHFTLLALAAARIDWENLPTERDPKVDSESDWFSYSMDYSRYGRAAANTSVPTPSQKHSDTLAKQRISLVEEAIFDWYWGRKIPLTDLLVARLATRENINLEDARSLVKIEKLREQQVDDLDLGALDDEILDDILAFVVAI